LKSRSKEKILLRSETLYFRAGEKERIVVRRFPAVKPKPNNQKITKGGVLRKLKSRPLLDETIPACETRNWNWKSGPKTSNWGYAYDNGFVVLAEGLDMFKLGVIATGGNMNLSDICPLRKELWFFAT
jgi:hypothetical protein